MVAMTLFSNISNTKHRSRQHHEKWVQKKKIIIVVRRKENTLTAMVKLSSFLNKYEPMKPLLRKPHQTLARIGWVHFLL